MITNKELEDLGFIADPTAKTAYNYKFYKKIDNGHIIKGHDTTEVFVTKNHMSILIELEYWNSYDSGKRVVFKGRCETIEFFTQILESVLKY